ncbi:MAG: rhodanese-like domain-containing protein [Fusobacteriaceae bacterium]|nr:rhodanese-like domain-containing protein [Fusobacteriaceae bacterium]MBP6323206.1 rhodanese-like domain-containing protein [Fusobacteriaceae bacterium]MBP9509600.1 rhodanese-like domain-containing protein [Fusobacteriaceae bacterium]
MENISLDKNKALEIIMDDDAIIIDVRTEEELEENPPISDDVYNIPFNNKFIEIIEEEELDKDTKILIYCSHGVRSIKAALLMREKGFTNVFSLEGGLEAILSGDGC